MIKTIKLSKTESITLSNNVGWTMEYLDQFGHDIIPDLMPLLSSVTNLVAGIAQAAVESGETVSYKDAVGLLARLNSATITDAIIELAGLRFVDIVNITWAMAKCADDDIPEPRVWVRQFESFPVDVIVPEVFNMVLSGMASSKNVKRLQKALKEVGSLKPSPSMTSSSPDLSEV